MEQIGITADAEKFQKRVAKKGPDECWLWTGAIDAYGYGVLHVGNKCIKAHRFSFELHKGPIPAGQCVLHSCDNPPCVNPGHLSAGSQLDNLADCRGKGRARPFGGGRKGSEHGRAKLSERQVRTIRSSPKTLTVFAKRYKVSITTVSHARTRKTWAHIA